MKITDVKIRYVEGVIPPEAPPHGAPLASKVRFLPEDNHYGNRDVMQRTTASPGVKVGKDRRLTEAFLNIETDEGITGVAGPIYNTELTVALIKNMLRGNMIGEDPINTERIWDILYRKDTLNYSGIYITAIAFCDIALWDIKCKKAGMPLWQMIGGATQAVLPAYANCTGCAHKEDGSGYDLDQVAELTKWCLDNGFAGVKWYPHRGPRDGGKGIDDLYDLFKTIREAGGPGFKMMLDVWSAWDVDYTLKAANKLAELDLFWIEEPVMPSMVDAYVELQRKSPIPIAAGENLLTRWGIKQFLEREALDIYQPDPVWCGGISESLKIMPLIALYDKRICLHGFCVPIAAQLAAMYTANICPISEFILNVTPGRQFFYKNPVLAKDGCLHLPSADQAGVGLDIDEGKVVRSWFLE